MRRYSIAAMATALTLAACGGADEPGETPDSGTAALGEAGGSLEPGQYETTVELLEFDMPGLENMPTPEGMPDPMAMMRSNVETTYSYCLTPEEASASALAQAREEAQEQMARDGDCRMERDESSSDSLDMTIVCESPDGSMTMDMTGEMTGNGTTMRMEATGDMGGEQMRLVTRHVSKRVGPCEEESGT